MKPLSLFLSLHFSADKVIFQIQHNGCAVFSHQGFGCNALTGFLQHHVFFLCLLHTVLDVTWSLGFAKGTSILAVCLVLQSDTVCSKNLEDRFFNNWRIWKENKVFESCSCNYNLISILYLQVPRKRGPKLSPHTLLHVFSIRIWCFVKVFRDTQNFVLCFD